MREILQSFQLPYSYPVSFTRGAFDPGNDALARAFARAGTGPHRVLPILDAEVARTNPGVIGRLGGFADVCDPAIELVSQPLIVSGGEASKSDGHVVQQVHELVEHHGLCRHSFVLAIGGGSMLDAVGYAAATAHRGVRLLRMPTTVLAQNDAGIGVKNAINFRNRKNFLGTFAPPFAVVNDLDFLETLPARELRSGTVEAVKVALIKDQKFFDVLYEQRAQLATFEPAAMESMIVRCAELHLEHIRTSGDPFELGSARPLDFGHWAAHKLEELSAHAVRHGEAVAIGIALDALYSHRMGMLDAVGLDRILTLLADLGLERSHPLLDTLDVARALQDFREHLGGELSVTVLEGIGRGVEVHEIDLAAMRACVEELHAYVDGARASMVEGASS